MKTKIILKNSPKLTVTNRDKYNVTIVMDKIVNFQNYKCYYVELKKYPTITIQTKAKKLSKLKSKTF